MAKQKNAPGRKGHPTDRAPAPIPAPQRALATRAIVIGSIIVGGSILAGSWMLKSSIDGTVARLDAIGTSLTETKQALEKVAANQGKPSAQQQRKRPDPNKRYTINTTGAPRKGPASARVQLVEFSDFQ